MSMEYTWKQRYKRMLRHKNWTNADVAAISGLKPESVKSLTQLPEFPRWARVAIVVFEGDHPILEGEKL